MDDEQSPLKYVLTHNYKDGMIKFVMDNPVVFDELFELSISDDQPYSWRSAWLIWDCIEDNDPRLASKIDLILDIYPSLSESQQREYLMTLDKVELNEQQEGILYNLCESLWKDVKQKASIRYRAFKMMIKIMKKYPELQTEFPFLITDYYIQNLSRGAKHSVNKLIHNPKLFNK